MEPPKATTAQPIGHCPGGGGLPLGRGEDIDMNPGTFVTLMILGWILLAVVTLWAILRVPLRRARLQKPRGKHKASSSRHHPLPH